MSCVVIHGQYFIFEVATQGSLLFFTSCGSYSPLGRMEHQCPPHQSRFSSFYCCVRFGYWVSLLGGIVLAIPQFAVKFRLRSCRPQILWTTRWYWTFRWCPVPSSSPVFWTALVFFLYSKTSKFCFIIHLFGLHNIWNRLLRDFNLVAVYIRYIIINNYSIKEIV